jgi:hypothetical protein
MPVRSELRRRGGGSRVQWRREAATRKAGNPAAWWDPAALPSRLTAPCVQPTHATELAIPAGGGEPTGLEAEVAGVGGGHDL